VEDGGARFASSFRRIPTLIGTRRAAFRLANFPGPAVRIREFVMLWPAGMGTHDRLRPS
jgi:hypothetical protein